MTSSYLHFPEFDPVIFSEYPVALHWYGLMYLVGFIFAMWLATRRANRPGSGWTKNEVENLLYAGFPRRLPRWTHWLCSVENFPQFYGRSACIFSVSDGGMSFHGGLIGVIVVMIIFARRTKRSSSRSLILLPHSFRLVLVLGAWATLLTVNCGAALTRTSRLPCCSLASEQKIFCCCKPTRSGNPFSTLTGALPRHPSQLYELLLERCGAVYYPQPVYS